MTLNLDPRQRAMLAEMGVRVWSPAEKAPAPVTAIATAPAIAPATAPATASASAPATALVAPVALSALPAGWASMDWDSLQSAAASCKSCGLCEGRQNSLFANRKVKPGEQVNFLIVGDAPTQAEDLAGQAFVDDEGVLLDAILHALGLSRTDSAVVITSAVKCHPPDKRNPSHEEIAQCQHYLQRQIELLQPQVVLALGRFAAQALLHDSLGEAATQPLGKLRGQVHAAHGTQVVVSYHPTYLLRSPSEKAKAWADWCLAKSLLGD